MKFSTSKYSSAASISVNSFWVLLYLLFPLSLHAQTQIANDIAVDTQWDTAGSPYIVSGWGVDVLAGATLTIEAGVEVRFECSGGLDVYGTLVSAGTVDQEILFTGTSKTPGCWSGINIIGSGDQFNTGSEIAHTKIEYGGGWLANIYLNQASLDLRDSTVQYSVNDGIYSIFSGLANMHNVSLVGNNAYAINIYDASVNPVMRNLSATGNGKDVVGMYSGTLKGSHIWENAGIPYEIYSSIDVASDASLDIEPGVDIRFDSGANLTIYGKASAIGTDAQRIRFTATNPLPGWWEGIHVVGGGNQMNQLVLDYADVEYAGTYYANIFVNETQVSISNSRIRHSKADGLYFLYPNLASSIVSSSITDNQGFGIQIYNGQQILAAHNWWGDASGPYHATCNTAGLGNRVSDGVIMTPFLTAENQDPGTLESSDAHMLEIRPERWFIPADGISEALIKIRATDSAGLPLPGRFVILGSDLGTVTNGLQTDFRGETAATVVSDTSGEATLIATLDYTDSCEYARSPSANIAFTEVSSGNELLPDTQAPYMNDSIEFDPQPITRGQPTEVSATIRNPNNFPITVDAVLSTGDFGIGQPLGEIATFDGQTVAAGGSATLSTSWTPAVSGHYCARMRYTASGSGSWSSVGDSYQNLEVAAGALGSGGEKRALDLAEKFTGILNHDAVTVGLNATSLYNIPYQMIHSQLIGYHLNWMFTTARTISRALGGDPPRLDYDVFDVPDRPNIPQAVATSDGLSQEHAEAINALTDAMLQAIYSGRAATISLDRYGGASAAEDLIWASRQADAMLYYKQRLGENLILVADRLDDLLTVAQDEGFSDEVLTLEQVKAYQQLLTSGGYSTDEISAAQQVGLSDAEIQAVLQEQINADPLEVTLSRATYVQQLVQAYQDLGNILTNDSSLVRNSLLTLVPESNLLRTHENSQTFTLANPGNSKALVELKIRRLDIPPEWAINVFPETITLAAHEETTGTIEVKATTAWIRGTRPRVAVEGYIGTQLIGGVVMDVLIPKGGLVGCSGQKVHIPDQTLFPAGETECMASESISTGAAVTAPDRSIVTFRSPATFLNPGFSAEKGSVIRVLSN